MYVHVLKQTITTNNKLTNWYESVVGKYRLSYLGKATAATRAATYPVVPVCM